VPDKIRVGAVVRPPIATTDGIFEYARRDLLDQVACLIEIFGVAGAAQIVGCL